MSNSLLDTSSVSGCHCRCHCRWALQLITIAVVVVEVGAVMIVHVVTRSRTAADVIWEHCPVPEGFVVEWVRSATLLRTCARAFASARNVVPCSAIVFF